MSQKIRKLLLTAVLLSFQPLATGCLPNMAILGGNSKPATIEVVQMTTPPPVQVETRALYCQVGRGAALFGRDWYDFSDTLFTLHQGSQSHVILSRVRHTEVMKIQAFFDGGGQKLIFCPVVDAAPTQRIACASLYTLEEDLQGGIKRTFDIPAAVRGGIITCAYDQTKFKPLTTPAAGGN